jgi:hypothetical protein
MPSVKMLVPANQSGDFHCNAVGQSGTVYRNIVPSSVMDVDIRDVQVFLQRGFSYAPTAASA